MVQPRNVARRETSGREPLTERRNRVVQHRSVDGVVCVGRANLVHDVAVARDTGASAVDDEDLARREDDCIWHRTRLGHLFDLPARGDAIVGEGHARTLCRGRVLR